MIIINVQNGNVEKALKEYKRKVQNTKQNQILRDRQEFVKPSVTRRTEIKKAKYIQSIKSQTEKD
jgi:small subunit ribosomal protein S21